jgi:GTPase Era involved in 16S rRNA processing
MTNEVKQLIDEAIELTGAAPPSMLEADAPVLSSQSDSIYLIGLVGGKEVGKTTLVNAIVGEQLSVPTSHGPGTEDVIAYAHHSAAQELRELLQREVPGKFAIVTHNIARLSRQVLLDLPDIDSRHGEHVKITRKMLRHMLYPLWIVSIEKYADQRPQQLLAAVAQGNDPANFIVCLNKADQLVAADAAKLRDDFADRIGRLLGISSPRVLLISATHPQKYDLPALRHLLSRAKSDSDVKQSQTLAQERQDRLLLGWFGNQRLTESSQQLARLEQDAQEMTASRIGVPLLDRAIPRMLDDPGQRMAIIGPAVRARLSRWPIVNAIDTLLSPMLALVQKNLSDAPNTSADPDAYLDGSVATAVQTTFAQLHQLHPHLGDLYQNQKLWESMHADAAAADLRRRFTDAIENQRQTILQRTSGRFALIFAPLRWLLTIGAILWFPIVQPILSAALQQGTWQISKQTLRAVVDVLSVSSLLQCVTFLLLWFAILWVLLRAGTHRRISRLIEQWKNSDDDASLPGQTLRWIDELLEPIHQRRQRIDEIVDRAEKLKEKLSADASGSDQAVALASSS